MLEQLDGRNVGHLEHSESKPLVSKEEWNDFNKNSFKKHTDDNGKNGVLEFTDPYAKKMIPEEADNTRQLKKEKALHLEQEKEDKMRLLKKEKALGEPYGTTFDPNKPNRSASEIIKTPDTDSSEHQPNQPLSEYPGKPNWSVDEVVRKGSSSDANGAGLLSRDATGINAIERKSTGQAPRNPDSTSSDPTFESRAGGSGDTVLAASSSLRQGYTVNGDGTVSSGIVRSQPVEK